MNNVFGNGLFGNQNQGAMDQFRQQLEYQQAQYNKMQQAQQQQQGSSNLLDEFKGVISSISQEEQQYLVSLPEFIQAKQIYEAGFIDFLGGKFAGEYLSTPVGKQAIENLIETTKNTIKSIKDAAKERNQKLEALAALAAEDPEIQKKLQEKLKGG